MILCGMWSLWNSHSDVCHSKTPIGNVQAIEWARDACYLLLTSRKSLPHDNGQPPLVSWLPPPEHVVKINCDGGFYVADMIGSTGVVMRHSEGSFQGLRHDGFH